MQRQKIHNTLRVAKSIVFLPLSTLAIVPFLITYKRHLLDVKVNRYFRSLVIVDFIVLLTCNVWYRTLFAHRLGAVLGKILTTFVFVDRTFILSYSTEIGVGLKLVHPFSTIINAQKVGSNVLIRNGITVGNKSEGLKGRPIIGDNVVFGVNSKVIGDVSIPSNTFLGAGVSVFRTLYVEGTYVSKNEVLKL